MRISDWSSDVCSSALPQFSRQPALLGGERATHPHEVDRRYGAPYLREDPQQQIDALAAECSPYVEEVDGAGGQRREVEDGVASCRERVCEYSWISVVAGTLTKTKKSR